MFNFWTPYFFLFAQQFSCFIVSLRMRFYIITFLIISFCSIVYGQRQNILSRSEIGVIAGGMYYIGDLNPYQHFELTQPAGGLFYKFNINGRLAFRIVGAYGAVKADDQLSKDPTLKNRNLNFSSTIKEIGLGMEFNYFPFQIGNKNYRGTGYMFAEIAYLQTDPSTNYEGQTYLLRTLGSEGQNTSLNSYVHHTASSQNEILRDVDLVNLFEHQQTAQHDEYRQVIVTALHYTE